MACRSGRALRPGPVRAAADRVEELLRIRRRPGGAEREPAEAIKAALKAWEGSRLGRRAAGARARAGLRKAASRSRASARARLRRPVDGARANGPTSRPASGCSRDAGGIRCSRASSRRAHDRRAAALGPFDLYGQLPTGTTVLEASAGTGKTYTIAALVTRFVAEGVAGLDQMLIVTFSRAATGELRERVRERLTSAERGLADPEAPRATNPTIRCCACWPPAPTAEVALSPAAADAGADRLRCGHHRHHSSVLRPGAGRAWGHRRPGRAVRGRPVRRVARRSRRPKSPKTSTCASSPAAGASTAHRSSAGARPCRSPWKRWSGSRRRGWSRRGDRRIRWPGCAAGWPRRCARR